MNELWNDSDFSYEPEIFNVLKQRIWNTMDVNIPYSSDVLGLILGIDNGRKIFLLSALIELVNDKKLYWCKNRSFFQKNIIKN